MFIINLMPPLSQTRFQLTRGFTLIELLVSVALIAILTATSIPSFTEFSRSQTLSQSFKSFKSDLRVAQSRSLAGAKGKAWGINITAVSGQAQSYKIFNCLPVATLLEYDEYVLNNGVRCPANGDFKDVVLSSIIKLTNLKVSGAAVNLLDVVFDSQNGATVVNGTTTSGEVEISLDFVSGSSLPLTVKITPGGGIID